MIPINTYTFQIISSARPNGSLIQFGAEYKQWNGTDWIDPTTLDKVESIIHWVNNGIIRYPKNQSDAQHAIRVDGRIPMFDVPQIITTNLTGINNLLIPKSAIYAFVNYDTSEIVHQSMSIIDEGLLIDTSALTGNYRIYLTKQNIIPITPEMIKPEGILLNGTYCVHGIFDNSNKSIHRQWSDIEYYHNETLISTEHVPADGGLVVSNQVEARLSSFPQYRDFGIALEIPVWIYDLISHKIHNVENLTLANCKTEGRIPRSLKSIRLILPDWFEPFIRNAMSLFIYSIKKELPTHMSNLTNYARNILIDAISGHGEIAHTQQALEYLFSKMDHMAEELNNIRIVGTIAERDALDVKGMVWVLDASDDPTVNSGAASYLGDASTSQWYKLSEVESLDFILSWDTLQGKPNSTPQSIDEAVTWRFQHNPNSHSIGMINNLQETLDNIIPESLQRIESDMYDGL